MLLKAERNNKRGLAVYALFDVMNIILTDEEMAQCREFAAVSAASQQAVEFGQHTTKARSEKEIARDNLIGKIAETAFSKMMKGKYGIDVPLDFNFYPRGVWDDQDAEINGWRIDVKGSRKGGHWLLIEWNKLVFRQRDDKLSHLYVMFIVDWIRKTDTPTGRVRYCGAASLNRLKDNVPTTQIFRKGSVLPGTHTVLQADNYGIRVENLYKHLNHLTAFLLKSPPPKTMTDNYRNPYTGETTLEILNRNDQN